MFFGVALICLCLELFRMYFLCKVEDFRKRFYVDLSQTVSLTKYDVLSPYTFGSLAAYSLTIIGI